MAAGPEAGSSRSMCWPQKNAHARIEGCLETPEEEDIESMSLLQIYDSGDCRAEASWFPLMNKAEGCGVVSQVCK